MTKIQFDLINSPPGRYHWRADEHGLHVMRANRVHIGTIFGDGRGLSWVGDGCGGGKHRGKDLGPFKTLEEAGMAFEGKKKP